MQSTLEELSKKVLHAQLSGIPESHRNQLTNLIKQTQEDIKNKKYNVQDKKELLTLTIDTTGLIKGLKIHEDLYKDSSDFKEVFSNFETLLFSTHKKAINIAKKDIDFELVSLQNKISILMQEINRNLNEK